MFILETIALWKCANSGEIIPGREGKKKKKRKKLSIHTGFNTWFTAMVQSNQSTVI